MHLLTYCLFQSFGFLAALLPQRALSALGRRIGSLAFYLYRPFRKKALANLAIAYGTQKTEKELSQIAKKSFQNIVITCLELFHFKKMQGKLTHMVTIGENHPAFTLLEKNQGVIFLSGHQANWELPFLAITQYFPGVGIGRPIRNPWLYRWLLSIREINGGTIIMPKAALKQGIKTLNEGKFIGIVGDQAFPESSYSYPLFGTRAWTTSAPALLAYKTKCPIVVATTERVGHRYILTGSSPIWPNLEKPMKEDVERMMDTAMSYLEASIKQHPEQWMWVHDRWKQQGIDHVKRLFRYGFILIILPPNPTDFLPLLPLLKKIYPRSFLTFFVHTSTTLRDEYTTLTYHSEEDLFIRDFRFQLVLDFYESRRVRRHFRKLGAFKTLSLSTMPQKATIEETLKHMLVKPECLTTVSL